MTDGTGAEGLPVLPEAEPTSNMWLNMLGLGGLAATINDPSFHAQVRAFAQAQFEMLAIAKRLESKLDVLLEVAQLDPSQLTTPGTAALPPRNGADGARPATAASGAADDGNRPRPPASRADR
jgi:hypothetical protein